MAEHQLLSCVFVPSSQLFLRYTDLADVFFDDNCPVTFGDAQHTLVKLQVVIDHLIYQLGDDDGCVKAFIHDWDERINRNTLIDLET